MVLLLTRHNGLGRTNAAELGEVGLESDEVVVRLEAGPQPGGSATAEGSAMTDPIAFFWEDDVDGRPCSDCWGLQSFGLQRADPGELAC